jgi:hypothetical protein
LTEPSRASDQALQAALARPLSPAEVQTLAALPEAILDATLRAFADAHGAAAHPVLAGLAAAGRPRPLRRAAKRALYRLDQRGVTPAAPPAGPRFVIARGPERAVRAWLSGIDGSGSRAAWILLQDERGGLRLCSLILNDSAGILDAAGGDITKKRLARELAELRATQKLPWVEADAARAAALVAEALALHRETGSTPPAAFARWQPLFASVPPPPLPTAGPVDEARLERSAELLALPELAGWFLDPEAVTGEALELLQARESRLVVTDQIRAEREAALVGRVLERELTAEVRRRWARRLSEMALVFAAERRDEHAALARAAAAGLFDEARDVGRHPLARGLASRALEVAGEIALGRLSAAEASRKPAVPPTST